MTRRAQYMYGISLPVDPQGSVGTGLGLSVSMGTTGLIPPTDYVTRTGEELVIDGVRIVVTHGHEIGSPNPPRLVSAYMHADVIVYGHTHQQLITKAARRIVVNPGAAGPRRFKLQPSVAKLYIVNGKADVELIPLGIPEAVVVEDDGME